MFNANLIFFNLLNAQRNSPSFLTILCFSFPHRLITGSFLDIQYWFHTICWRPDCQTVDGLWSTQRKIRQKQGNTQGLIISHWKKENTYLRSYWHSVTTLQDEFKICNTTLIKKEQILRSIITFAFTALLRIQRLLKRGKVHSSEANSLLCKGVIVSPPFPLIL